MEKEFKKLILISGNEEYLKDHKKNSLLNSFGSGESFSFNSFTNENLDLNELWRLSETVPFPDKYRRILITDSGLFSKNNPDCNKACDIFSDIPESTVIIFCEKDVSPANPLFKLFKKQGQIFNYDNVETLRGDLKDAFKTKVRSWVKNKLKSQGKTIDSRDLYWLLELTGYDMQNLSTELEKLISYTFDRPDGYKITITDVEAICSRTVSDKVFSMLDMKLRGNIEGAIALLEELFSLKTPASKILSLLERQYFEALSVRAYIDGKAADKDILKEMEIRDWQLRRLKKQVYKLSYDELLRHLEESISMDYKIKSGEIGDRLALEILLLD